MSDMGYFSALVKKEFSLYVLVHDFDISLFFSREIQPQLVSFDFEHMDRGHLQKATHCRIKEEVPGFKARIMSTICGSQQPSTVLINKEGGRMRSSPLLTAAALNTLFFCLM